MEDVSMNISLNNDIINQSSSQETKKYHKQNFKIINEKGERIYNIEKIINHLSSREGKGLVRDVCNIIGEERRDLLEKTYALIEKEFFIKLVEKALKIQNEGGLIKQKPNKILNNENFSSKELLNENDENELNINDNISNEKNKKSTGGVLFNLIKTESGISKQNLKEIFKKNYQGRNQRKKIIKKMEKLLINI